MDRYAVRQINVDNEADRTKVLVWDDVMGTWPGHTAKFVRRFGDVAREREGGVEGYVTGVREGSFPNDGESYSMVSDEWNKFLAGDK